MSDKYSVDDILAEIEVKRRTEPPENRDGKEIKIKPFLTEEVEEIVKPKKSEKFNESKLQELKSQKPVIPDFSAETSESEFKKPEKAQAWSEPFKTEIVKPKSRQSLNKANIKEKEDKKNGVYFAKAKNLPKPIIENLSNYPENNKTIKQSEISPYKGTTARFSINQNPRKRISDDTDNIEIFDEGYKPPKFSDTENLPHLKSEIFTDSKDTQSVKNINAPGGREEELRRLKEQSVLIADKKIEHHEDFIEGINPYEVIKKAEEGFFLEHTMTIGNLSGDTRGIAGDDLKDIAEKAAEINQSGAGTVEVGVKAYVPPAKKLKEGPPAELPPSMSDTSNIALIESLNKAIKKREQNEAMLKGTIPIATKPDLPIPQKAVNVLNINYKKQILKDTTLIPNGDPIEFQEKMTELGQKRKRRIKDFVLEEHDKEPEDDDPCDPDDFDSYDSSDQIWDELCDSHKALKFRFLILFIITGILTAVTVCNDFGINMAYRVLGFEVLFLDRRFDTFAYIAMQALLGITGLVACKGVLSNGIKKLFSRQGDCDSICAVSSVISVAGAGLMLLSSETVRAGQAHLYVAVGLGALMFNTIGKILMIRRAKLGFRFISGDSSKYYADILKDDELADAFTKGAVSELPVLCAMRKTEFLTDFLKSTYCTDIADTVSKTLTPIALLVSGLLGLIAFFFPSGHTEMQNNIGWSITVCAGIMSAFSSFSVMFAVNNPFSRASKQLNKYDSAILGYSSATSFADVNSILIDASALFPAGSIAFCNIKRCQGKNSINKIAIDEAIITAASLAIKSGSILSNMFYDIIVGKSEMLYEVENCIYEANMGITGWIGPRRVMLGNREQMKHHSIIIPDRKIEKKYIKSAEEVVYLASGGEAVAMFFIDVLPNPETKRFLHELVQKNEISVIIKTRDSLVTVGKISDIFDVDSEKIKILPFSLHEKFDECTRYTSKGRGDLSCNGTFTSFASALVTAKKLVKDISYSAATVLASCFFALILGAIFTLFTMTDMFSASAVLAYNLIWLVLMLTMQSFRKYG
ncbi:MAG: hypothetical protein LBR74_06395 [Eubacterium sp.]|nr:hypothetical protein [Eubacterium sp.]